MIILDTHIWVWSAQGDKRLGREYLELIQGHESGEIGICASSLWEVAKAVELQRLSFAVPVEDWFSFALSQRGIILLPLTPSIALESTRLPGNFHKDPFDQLIVATARILDVPLVTVDSDIVNYPHVKLLP